MLRRHALSLSLGAVWAAWQSSNKRDFRSLPRRNRHILPAQSHPELRAPGMIFWHNAQSRSAAGGARHRAGVVEAVDTEDLKS
jgi:hypothetical protein